MTHDAFRYEDGLRILISYPIGFDGAAMGSLRLPKDLTMEEAARLKQLIDSLVLVAAAPPEAKETT